MRNNNSFALLILTCSLALARAGHAQNAPNPVETATYDVSYFLDKSRPHDDKPTSVPGPVDPDAPIGGDALPSRTKAKENFIKLVRETIDPTSWQPGHIPPASIAFQADEKLLVIQTAENQRGMLNLLQQLKGDGSEKLQADFDTQRSAKTHFENAPLAQTIKDVSTTAKITIVVDWKTFQAANIVADAPVSIDLNNATTAQAIRAIFNSAAGHELGLRIDATPKAIQISFDNVQPQEQLTRVYNLRAMTARASGLDVTKPFTRAQALAAIVKRIKSDILHSEHIREMNGYIIVSGPAIVLRDITTFLDEIDAKAIAEAASAKPAEQKLP